MTIWLIFVPMVLVAILFVLWRVIFPPGLSRDPENDLAANRSLFLEKMSQLQAQLNDGEIDNSQFHALELEFQRQFLADCQQAGNRSVRRGAGPVVVGCALLIPVVALILYQQLGAVTQMKLRDLLEQRSALFAAGELDSDEFRLATRDVIDTMGELAKKEPEDPTYQVLLARLHADQGAYDKAIPYYLRATVLLPENGDILAEYAQVLFFSAGNKMTDRVAELTIQALQFSPHNHTALSLAGIARFNRGEYRQAIDYWTQAQAQLPPAAPSGIALESGIAAARERLGESASVAAKDEQNDVALTLQVSLGKEIDVPGDTTVFVYARTWQGSPMPLAIARLKVSDLPTEIVLTDAMAMTPDMSLDTVEAVEVIARVSLSGAPTPAPGDYQASAGPIDVKNRKTPISLPIINQIAE